MDAAHESPGVRADALVERLVAAGDERGRVEHAAHRARLALLRADAQRPLDAAARVDAAVARLRELTTPSALLAAAPAALGAASDFDRVVLSSVRDGAMTAEAAWLRRDRSGAARLLEALRASPAQLVHPLVETELVRRRRPLLVADAAHDPRVHAPTAALMGWSAYVAAPVVVGRTAIALLQADRSGRGDLGEAHRELLWAFAGGLAQAYEAASLRRTLRAERQALRALLDWLDARSRELADAPIALDAGRAASPRETGDEGRVAPVPGPVDTLVFDGLLTRRELEVLRLLGEGRTNRAIASELVISAGTVKFHVNRILTKLHVANRAEAVARYYALVGAPPRG